MIEARENLIHIQTKDTSYIIEISKYGHLLNLYYGVKIPTPSDISAIQDKWTTSRGTSVAYDANDETYFLDRLPQEVPSVGKGDYREPALLIESRDGFIFDPIYESHEIRKYVPNEELPSPHGDMDELVIKLKEKVLDVYVYLHYVIDEENNVIVRSTEIEAQEEITIKKIASMSLDINDVGYEMVSLYGAWANEANKDVTPIGHTAIVIDSKAGTSSNRHNPFFMIKEKETTASNGNVYAFNLIYSGNHQEYVERSTDDKIRIQTGINPFAFSWKLGKGERFASPYALMTFSDKGLNGASQNMHGFIKEKIIPSGSIFPPILVNNWEATYMKFTDSKLRGIIKNGKDLGLEMFCLDDGWFGRREDDTKGLGDYDVNTKKLPHGLKGISKYTHGKGMKFGLWFEPEMVSENSLLYETHPDWALISDNRPASTGRHQYYLDLSKKEVQDYIIENVGKTIDENQVDYVKWDMNRSMSDITNRDFPASEMVHRYMLGLYRVFRELVATRPHVYWEGCASGGNRFDLGIMRYFSQIWASDDTDAYQRLHIQSGISLGYPLRSISNHVNAETSHQALRVIPLYTRMNVAMFGAFGFECDLATLTAKEKKIVKEGVDFYKEHRDTFINGNFHQFKDIDKDGYTVWEVVSKDGNEAIVGFFNGLQKMAQPVETLKIAGLNPEKTYQISVKTQDHDIRFFGGLINMVLPVRLDERGSLVRTISKFKSMDGEKEVYEASGASLMHGAVKLNPQWSGVGFNEGVRVLGDFGSRIYVIKAK